VVSGLGLTVAKLEVSYMTQVLRDEYESGEREQQESNQARHIKNNVDKARKDHHLTGQRWPFELLQNAHDPGSREGLDYVDVVFDWKNTAGGAEFTFKHNGAPFLPQDLAALLSGGSNKDYHSEKTTGRYGTGFLMTHVLSTRTEVGGLSATSEGMERFNTVLNRSGDQEDILKNIKDSKTDFGKAIRVDAIANLPSAEFKYYVDNSSALHRGLTSLREALPYLFATCPFLGSVKLHIGGGNHESWSADHEIETRSNAVIVRERKLQLKKAGETTDYQIFNISSAATMPSIIVAGQLIGSTLRACIPPDSLPRIFRRFPIQFSSALPICFVVDGLFNVGEDRQKVYFESEEDEKLVRDALSLIPTAMRFVLDNGWDRVHLLSKVLGPKPSPFIGDNIDWWQRELTQVAKRLSQMPLVKTDRGMGRAVADDGWTADFVAPLFTSSLPRCVHYERLWDLIRSTDHFIPPNLAISPDWTSIAEGWNELGVKVSLITLEGLASEIRKTKDGTPVQLMDQLRVLTDKHEWLARFLDLVGEALSDLEAIDLGIVDGLMPDQLGHMHSPRELVLDGGIPEDLKDIGEAVGADVRSFLVDTELIATAQRIGLAHTDEALQKLVTKVLTEDEVIERCLKSLDEKLVSGARLAEEESALLPGSIQLLEHIWKTKGELGATIAKRCPFVASDNTIVRLTDSQPIMAPVSRWPDKAQPFFEAYPEKRVLAPMYAGDPNQKVPDVVEALIGWKIVYDDILMKSSPALEGDRLRALAIDESDVEGLTLSGESFSQIALLAKELIPRSGTNVGAAKALLGLTLAYVAPRDHQWRLSRVVEGSKDGVKVPISVREALWVADLQHRAWVPAKAEGKTISVGANSSNLEELLDPSWLDGNNNAIELMSNCFGYDALTLRLLVAATDENGRQEIRDELANVVEAAGNDIETLKDLRKALEARKKQKSEIGKWRKLGLAVQAAVQEALEARNLKVTVIDVGGDFEVVIQEGGVIDEATLARLEIRDFIVEVKATTQGEPRMTPAQAVNAAAKPERYVLCVVDLRKVPEIDLDTDWTAPRVEPLMRLLPDIGRYVRDPTDLIAAARNCEVRIRNDAVLRYGVPAEVWETGSSLDDWLTNITAIVIES
jgi:hypothetical protein